MKELITQNLSVLRATTGRSDLIDPISAELITLERQIDQLNLVAQRQESIIESLNSVINVQNETIEKIKSRSLWHRIINKVL